MPQQIPQVQPDIGDNVRTNYVAFASFTVLIWDHLDTFADEVECIWKGKKSPFVYLFLFNRYVTPLGFMINLYAYLSPSWTYEVLLFVYQNWACLLTNTNLFLSGPPSGISTNCIHDDIFVDPLLIRCARFVRYEGCTVALAVEVVGLMMLLRIRALYSKQRWIIWGLALFLMGETAVNIWLISGAGPVIHNSKSGVHACSMVFDSSIPGAASSSAWIPLLYDTMIFGLTLYRTIPSIRKEEASFIIKRLLEDGLLYYSVIFTVTLILTIMIIAAPSGTKNIAAQTEQLIAVAMMSRITLNLKKAGLRAEREPLHTSKSLLFDWRRWRVPENVQTLQTTSNTDTYELPLRFAVPPPRVSQLQIGNAHMEN